MKRTSVLDGAPTAGQFLGRVLDSLTDGDTQSLVASVKKPMESLDIVRLIVKAMKSTVMKEADATDKAMSATAVKGKIR